MPRIIVTTGEGDDSLVTLDEQVTPSELGAKQAPSPGDVRQGAPLAQIANAVREHESATRKSLTPARGADRHLYRRLRRALGR